MSSSHANALRAGVVLVALVAAVPAHSSPTGSTLAQAGVIRAEVNAEYLLLPGRKLVVTEATSTGVVKTLTLVTDWLEPRLVPADNGIYFAICPAGATCPYPARAAARSPFAFLPRREALELALLAFQETSVSLVVVGLPTAEPTWAVFERDDLFADAFGDAPLRDLVDRLTLPRLFRPLPILPPPPDTLYAVRLP